jgi:hypothetical protein
VHSLTFFSLALGPSPGVRRLRYVRLPTLCLPKARPRARTSASSRGTIRAAVFIVSRSAMGLLKNWRIAARGASDPGTNTLRRRRSEMPCSWNTWEYLPDLLPQ